MTTSNDDSAAAAADNDYDYRASVVYMSSVSALLPSPTIVCILIIC